MKAFMIVSMISAGSIAATSSQAQVYVRAGIGFRVPAPRVYVAPAPVVAEPAPVYDDSYVDPYADPNVDPYAEPLPLDEGYAPAVEFYYNYPAYPAWNGHFRDRFYFEHYRPYFERYRTEHFRGNYGGRPGFARGGFVHRDAGRGGFERGSFGRGSFGRGNFQRGAIGQRENSHGGSNRGGFGRGGNEHGGGRRH